MTVAPDRNTITDAVQYLASVCDWAETQDGQGFNGTDTGLGHFLATLPEEQWTPEMRITGYEMVRKYRRQLSGVGIDFDSITEPEGIEAARHARDAAQAQRTTINRNRKAAEAREAEKAAYLIDFVTGTNDPALNGRWTLATPRYVPEIVDAARAVPTRRWNGRVNTFQGVPHRGDVVAALKRIADQFDFTVTPAAQRLFDSLADDIAVHASIPDQRIVLEDGKLVAYMRPEDGELRKAIKTRIDGRRYDPETHGWSIPAKADNALPLEDIVKTFKVAIMPDAQSTYDQCLADGKVELERRAEAGKLSSAMDADIEMPADFGFDLFPFQRAGVDYVERARRTFLADEQGTGKTIQMLAAIRRADAYPAVIVTPAAVKLKWLEEARKALPGKRCIALSGKAAKLDVVLNADVIILNWDILSAWAGTKGIARGKNKQPDKPGVLTRIGVKSVGGDESHYAKEPKSQRTRAYLMLCESVYREQGDDALLVNMTGSPVLNRPVELIPQLEAIGRLEDFGGFFKFAKRYCAAYKDDYTGKWDFSGSSNTDELNAKLKALCMVRRLKKDVLTELPPKTFTRVPMELTNLAEYKRAEADVIAWLQDNVEVDQDFMASLAGLSPEERKLAIARRREEATAGAQKAEELARMNTLRQVAARGLIKPSLAWALDFLESTDEKLVIFAYHKEVQTALLEGVRAAGYKAVSIFGGEHGKRHDVIFQTDPSVRVVVASLTAAREGIDLYAASNALMVEHNWSPKTEEQAEDRIHRIGQVSDSANYWYAHPAGPEDNIYDWQVDLLEGKREVANGITDGDGKRREVESSVLSGVIKRALAKAAA